MNKWFSIRGGEDLAGNVAAVQQLLSHPAFDAKNPNKWHVPPLCSCQPLALRV